MTRRLHIIIFLVTALATIGCVKETYDMNKFSKRAHISPTLTIAAFRGDMSLDDLVDQNDTVVFDENNFVRIVFREDTILEFEMEDYYDLNDMVSFSQSYPIGDLNLSPFLGTVTYTLDQISQHFTPALRAQFVALDDGSPHDFPVFPETDLGEIIYSPFPDFEYAVFKEGSVDILVENNLTAPLSGARVRLYNTLDHSQIGNEAVISLILPGETGLATIDIADATVRNSITAAIVLTGSPGASNVIIDLDGSNVEITIAGRDMKVKSGRVIVPTQILTSLDNNDTVQFDPGTDVEIDIVKITAGNVSYTVQSATPLTSVVSLTLPTALRGGIPVTESITVNPNTTFNGNISVDNTTIDLGTITSQPYNLLPVEYLIEVSSNGNMVNFSSTDEINLDLELLNPTFDYVKGYFGQQTETIDPDTIDLDIKEILDHISSGSFLLTNPSIKLLYSNSFAVPIEIALDASGHKKAETVDLGLAPFILNFPAAPAERDKDDVFIIDRNNSELPELVSMPPEEIRFSGSSVMNPLGNDGSRENYIFGDSRFVSSLEVEVPMEMRINNLQFKDTVDNFMQNDDPDEEIRVNPEDFEFLRIDISAENGFPLGVSVSITLYDSTTQVSKCTIDAMDVLEPAPVGSNGRVTEPRECTTSIEITREFWSSINDADKIIFTFTLVTTDDGTKDVKFYSDYRIDFKAAIVLKPDIKFDLE